MIYLYKYKKWWESFKKIAFKIYLNHSSNRAVNKHQTMILIYIPDCDSENILCCTYMIT